MKRMQYVLIVLFAFLIDLVAMDKPQEATVAEAKTQEDADRKAEQHEREEWQRIEAAQQAKYENQRVAFSITNATLKSASEFYEEGLKSQQ